MLKNFLFIVSTGRHRIIFDSRWIKLLKNLKGLIMRR